MSYKHDDMLVILNKYGKASGAAKSELYETYDRIRDLTVSGPTISGSGLGGFSSLLMNAAKAFGATSFSPTFGNESMVIPGTSYYSPISGGAGVQPGGQAAFGLAPFSQYTGFPTGGAAPLNGLMGAMGSGRFNASSLSPLIGMLAMGGIGAIGAVGSGLKSWWGIGDAADEVEATTESNSIGGIITGGASPIDGLAGSAGGVAAAATGAARGTAAGIGFGRNWVMPLASIAGGLGGLLTTLGPFFGPYGLAGVAAGSILNGISGSVLASYQNVSNRIIANSDTILTNKVHNLETTIKMLDAQSDILKKLLKESVDGDKKALDNL